MAIEKQTGLFYEILIRGNAGGDHVSGGLGDFAGAHYIEGTAIVDDGVVVSYTPGPATDLPRDKIVAYLGDKFAGMEAQQRDLVAQIAAAQQIATEATNAASAKAAADLAARDATIAELTVRLKTLGDALLQAHGAAFPAA